MGALFTVNPPAEPGMLDLPWIVTIGPLDDMDDWEPVLCGPYERPHALALARAVVAEHDLMAVVEPVQPYTSVAEIQASIAAAQATIALERAPVALIFGETPEAAIVAAFSEDNPDGEPSADQRSPAGGSPGGHPVAGDIPEDVPTPDQVRSGFVRIAKRLSES